MKQVNYPRLYSKTLSDTRLNWCIWNGDRILYQGLSAGLHFVDIHLAIYSLKRGLGTLFFSAHHFDSDQLVFFDNPPSNTTYNISIMSQFTKPKLTRTLRSRDLRAPVPEAEFLQKDRPDSILPQKPVISEKSQYMTREAKVSNSLCSIQNILRDNLARKPAQTTPERAPPKEERDAQGYIRRATRAYHFAVTNTKLNPNPNSNLTISTKEEAQWSYSEEACGEEKEGDG